jgi:hypothetical protein
MAACRRGVANGGVGGVSNRRNRKWRNGGHGENESEKKLSMAANGGVIESQQLIANMA